MRRSRVTIVAAMATAILASAPVMAAEGGVTQLPVGGDGFSAAYLPPPGVWEVLSYTFYRGGDRFNDGGGQRVGPADFNLRIIGEAVRLLRVHELQFLGADVASQMIVPVVRVDLQAGGRKSSTAGVGDITVTPLMLSWHHSATLHALAGFDFNLPTGNYSKDAFINIGANHYSFTPFYGITYTVPDGPELMLAAFYNFSTVNGATHYQNGDEFLLNFAFGWNVGRWIIGAQGSWLSQLSDDRWNGIKVGSDGNRGTVLSLGPSVKYTFRPDIYAFAWWERDVIARDTLQGDRVVAKLAILF